jgi:hypothetical protein
MTLSAPRFRYEGHAIVSADGMIADAEGRMPEGLRNETDWAAFQAALDAAAIVVVGRLGHRRHANPGRRRLVATSGIPGLATDRNDPLATLWNPAGIGLDDALADLGITGGTVAVTGGTRVFDLFLPLYTSFSLSEANGLALPGGTPAFSAAHPRAALAAAGLIPADVTLIDALSMVTSTRWERLDSGGPSS